MQSSRYDGFQLKSVDTGSSQIQLNDEWGQFAICIIDTEPDLEAARVYRVVPDESAARSDYLRIVDQSGEDYLYPASYFLIVNSPLMERRYRKWAIDLNPDR